VTGQGILLRFKQATQPPDEALMVIFFLPDYLIQDKASLKTSTEEGLPVVTIEGGCSCLA
jgi:hypothetical protein